MKDNMDENCECKTLTYEEFKNQFNLIKSLFHSRDYCGICLYTDFRKMVNYLFIQMIGENFTCEGVEILMRDFITFTETCFEKLKKTEQWKRKELDENKKD